MLGARPIIFYTLPTKNKTGEDGNEFEISSICAINKQRAIAVGGTDGQIAIFKVTPERHLVLAARVSPPEDKAQAEISTPVVKGLAHDRDTLAVYMNYQINPEALENLEGMQARSLAQAAKNAKRMTTAHNVQSIGNLLNAPKKPPEITKSGILFFSLDTSSMLSNEFEASSSGLTYQLEDATLSAIQRGGAHFGKITTVQTSMYSDRVFTLGDDGTLRCWEYRQKKFEQVICRNNSIIDASQPRMASKIEEVVSEDRLV